MVTGWALPSLLFKEERPGKGVRDKRQWFESTGVSRHKRGEIMYHSLVVPASKFILNLQLFCVLRERRAYRVHQGYP